MDEFVGLSVDSMMDEARRIVGDTPCYVSFDIDSIDPSFATGAGTPIVEGFTTREAIAMVRRLRCINIAGGNLVEISPPFDVA
jgi:guanidinopropionase